MSSKITVIRHHRENLKKCSMRGLEGRENFQFFKAKDNFSFDASGMILLEIGAPEISERDAGLPLLLLDSTWRLLPNLRNRIYGNFIPRSLPSNIKTAYPRISKTFDDPNGGLATIEALYAALRLSGTTDDSILDGYFFKSEFLKINAWA